ncbi:MAG: complement resistance protein TraT, partial [Candidatus Methanomethylicaceae archaeon]
FIVVIVLGLSFMGLTSCAQTMHAIEHAKMTTTVKMSDTIFLDAATLAKNRKAYVRVTNTSDMQEIAFEGLLKDRLAAKGIALVNDPSEAGYIIQANVLYMDYEKKGLTADGMLAGGYGGAVIGAIAGGDWKGSLAGATIGAVAGSLIGGAIGAAFKVETFFGAVDVQIQEKVEGGVRGVMTTDASQGSATRLKTEREIKSDYQTYRTRIVAKATQTNIDRVEAAGIISEKLAQQIAGMF